MNSTTTPTHATTTVAARPSGGTTGRSPLGMIADRRTYQNLAYLLLGLPIGTLTFCLTVTAIAVAVGMLPVALIGIPLLIGVWHGIHHLADVERRTANLLLGTDVRATTPAPATGGLWRRFVAQSSDRDRWRELAFVLLRFPVGVATFVAAVTAVAVPASVIYAPFHFWLSDDPEWGDWAMNDSVETLASSYPWSWLLVPAGLVMAVGALHVLNALADACGRWTEGWFAHDPSPIDPTGEGVNGVVSAPPRASVAASLVRIHALTFGSAMAALAVIDIADGGGLWLQWPLITWGPVVGLHALLAKTPTMWTTSRRGTLLWAHVATFAMVSTLLLLVDVAEGGGVWFLWPFACWGALVGMHHRLATR